LSSATTTTPIQDLRAWLARHNLDAVYVTKPVSIAYLTGFHAEPYERLMALALLPDRATLIVPALEQEKASRHSDQVDVVSWRDGEDAYARVRTALEGCVEVGVEKEHLTVHAAETLVARTAVREMVDASAEIRRLRRVKNHTEIEKLARAAAITDAATEVVLDQLRDPGAMVSPLYNGKFAPRF